MTFTFHKFFHNLAVSCFTSARRAYNNLAKNHFYTWIRNALRADYVNFKTNQAVQSKVAESNKNNYNLNINIVYYLYFKFAL